MLVYQRVAQRNNTGAFLLHLESLALYDPIALRLCLGVCDPWAEGRDCIAMGLSQTLGVGFSLLGNTFGKNSSPQRFGSIQFDGLPVVSVAEKKGHL